MKKIIALLFILCLIVLQNDMLAYAFDGDFSKIFEHHGSIMLIIDSETGDILYANNAASTFYKYSKEQLQSMKIQQINTLTPEETEKEMALAVQEERNHFIFNHRLADDDVRTVQVYSYPYIGQERLLLFSIITDITDKVQLEQRNNIMELIFFILLIAIVIFLLVFINLLIRNSKKLKEKNEEIVSMIELQKTFMDASSNLIYLKDEELKYVIVNKAFERFYFIESAEIIGKDDYALSDEAFADLRRKTDLDVVEKKAVIVDEVRWNNRIYETTKFPVKLLNGKYGVGAYIKEITDDYNNKKKIERNLHRNQVLVDVLNRNFKSTQEQLDFVLQECLKLTGSEYGYIYLYDEDKQEFVINSWSKGVMSECDVLEYQTIYHLEKTGLWGEVVRLRMPIIVNDYEKPHPLKKGHPEGHVNLKRFMSVPVIIDDKIVAVVGLANKEEEYDDNDLYQVSALMNGVWNAVERREMLMQLQMERNKYLLTILSIGDGVMVVDKDGKIEMLNKVAQELTGWEDREAVGKHYKRVFVLSHENEKLTINDPIEAVFKTGAVQELSNHAMLTAKNGKRYHLADSAAPIMDSKGEVDGVVLVFRDVTEKRAQREQIEYLSYHDSLTGIYNRGYFEQELKNLDIKENLPISLIIGDVNGLKLTNDIFGHLAGDTLLQKAADAMKNSCRKEDIVARWGGDEFIILLPNTNSEEAKVITQKIKHAFANESIEAFRGSISLGHDTKTHEEEDIFNIINNAEENMYSEKTLDRKRFNKSFIDMIMKTLHECNPKEQAHAKRVSELSQEIGRTMGLSEVEIRRLKDVGLLHDIGKIVLDKQLLKKEDALSEKDMQDYRQHPVVGFRILNASPDTMELATDVLDHHERWDGKGYPKGLIGEAITLPARILAVAESYDVMTSHTSYKKALSKAEAIFEMLRNAGEQFDPKVVDALVKTINRKKE